jgi:hypothetical protein
MTWKKLGNKVVTAYFLDNRVKELEEITIS